MASHQKKGPPRTFTFSFIASGRGSRRTAPTAILALASGSLIKWRTWEGRNKEFLALKRPGTVWLLTVRPDEAVWLIGVYDRATLKNRRAPFRIQGGRQQ